MLTHFIFTQIGYHEYRYPFLMHGSWRYGGIYLDNLTTISCCRSCAKPHRMTTLLTTILTTFDYQNDTFSCLHTNKHKQCVCSKK